MAAHQQDHKQFKAALNSLLEEKFENQKVQLEKMECSINKKIQVLQETVNQLQLQLSALPSNTSSLPHQTEPSASRSFQLCFNFEGNFPNAFLTKINIEDEIASLTVELCDHTGKRVEVVLECLKDLKVKFLVLDGDLKDDCTEEDFKKYIAIPRKNKPALLKDNCEVSLSNGSARVRGFSFTDNSSRSMKNGKFRLGAQPINGDRFGWIVRSAVSPPFQVKENRLKADQKHTTPSPTDELYRLKNISKNGPVYRRALHNEVHTVMDFLQLYNTDAEELPSILGITGAKSWKETADNAKECDLTKERYKYIYHDDESGDVLLLKCDFKIASVTFKGQTSQPYESLDDSQKEKVGILRKAAYKKRKELKKVYDSTNQTPVEAGLEYPSSVEQQEQGEHEQQRPAPPSNMDSNVPDAIGLPEQICSNPAADHDSCQQDMMNTSASLTANAYGVQDTVMEAGTNSSVAYEYLTEQIAYGLDSQEIPDITPAYQGDMNMQRIPNTIIDTEDIMSSPFLNWFSNMGDEDFNPFTNQLWIHSPANMMPSSANIGVGHKHKRSWCIPRAILRVIWLRRGAINCRPQKKQKI